MINEDDALRLILLYPLDLRRLEAEQGKKSDVMANNVLIESLIVLSLSKKINRPKTLKQNKYEAKK